MAVEKVESVLKTCPLVEQIWVYGNSFESCLVAVVVPQKKALMAWAAKHGLQGTYEVRHAGKHTGASWQDAFSLFCMSCTVLCLLACLWCAAMHSW